MMTFAQILQWLGAKLLPNGRAFRVPEPKVSPDYYTTEDGLVIYTIEDGTPLTTGSGIAYSGGIIYRFLRAVNLSIARAKAGAKNIEDTMLPDNPNFTIEDARVWYRRLGIYDSGSVSLADMSAAIRQKQSFPNSPLGKQSLQFIEDQLRLAGFDVRLYKNKFSDGMGGFITKTPSEVLGSTLPIAMYGYAQYGTTQYGQVNPTVTIEKVVTYLEPTKDLLFNEGSNLRATFFVAGATITTFAAVPLARKIEFRQLLLKLKATQMCAYTFINYV